MTTKEAKELKRSPLERRAGQERRGATAPPPGGVDRRKTKRRDSISDRRSENNVQLATFYLGTEFFGVHVARVQEIIRPQQMTTVPTAELFIRGLINLRGQIVTAIDLRRTLGMPDVANTDEQMNLIINFTDGSDSLLVDRIGDVIEVDASKIDPPPSSMKGIDRKYVEGVCKLDRQLLAILDVDRVTGRVE
jgi:purine-binding chemotaxis protein CheW